MSNIFNILDLKWTKAGSGNRGFFGLFKGRPKEAYVSEGAVHSRRGHINTDEAVKVSAILSAVRVISQGVAQASRQVVERKFDANKRRWVHEVVYDRTDELDTLLRERPNNYQTMFEFIECMVARAALNGNAFALIVRSTRRALELHPLLPRQVKVLIDENRKVYYEVAVEGAGTRRYEFGEIFHLKGPSLGGVIGDNILEKASTALELSLAAETAQLETVRRRGRRDGIVSHPGPVTEERINSIQNAFGDKFSEGGSGGIAILDNGAGFSDFTQSSKDMELIEHRKFEVDEMGRYFGVYSQLLNQHAANSAYASVEQVFIAHETNTLEPWYVRFEEAIKRDVIGFVGSNRSIYLHFGRGELTKGTAKDTAEYMKTLVGWGVLTPNEARAKMGLNPLDDEGADTPMTQLNMRSGYLPTEAEMRGKLSEPAPAVKDSNDAEDPVS